MKLLQFFDEVPRLRVQDPLARLLACADDGVLEYGFGDAVRLTGHACPTVASAYWLTYLALEHLYPDTLPQRGASRSSSATMPARAAPASSPPSCRC